MRLNDQILPYIMFPMIFNMMMINIRMLSCEMLRKTLAAFMSKGSTGHAVFPDFPAWPPPKKDMRHALFDNSKMI